MRAWLWVAALAVAAGVPTVHAETLYVIEEVVVSVNAAMDGSGERIAQIHSGDHVELLDRDGDHARVRLLSGEEGWMKASYLSANQPLREQLNARAAELDRARRENVRLTADLAAARRAAAASAASAPATEPGTTEAPAAGPAEDITSMDATSPAGPPLFAAGTGLPARPTWVWALAASLAALVVGFALGWRTLDRRIRAKYGGLRIY